MGLFSSDGTTRAQRKAEAKALKAKAKLEAKFDAKSRRKEQKARRKNEHKYFQKEMKAERKTARQLAKSQTKVSKAEAKKFAVEAQAAADAQRVHQAERAIDQLMLRLHRGQRLGAVGGVDRRQLLEQRGQPPRPDGVLVHETRVQVADALLIRALGSMGVGRFGDEVADLFLGAVVERPEGAVGRPVAGDLVLGEPAAVDVTEQIVLRPRVAVDVPQIDSGLEGCRFYRHPDILPEPPGYPHRHAR